MAYKVIDVSHWQGNIDFNKVKAAGVWGVIIKAGGSDGRSPAFYKDAYFESNYKKAVAAGLHVGCYYFFGKNFLSAADGKADAERFYNIIKGKKFDLPIYGDIEPPIPAKHKTGVLAAAKAFADYLESKRYFVGFYGSEFSTFRDRVSGKELENRYSLWVARYGSKPNSLQYAMWQYADNGKIAGISGNAVDLNACYKNFPEIIKGAKLNGY